MGTNILTQYQEDLTFEQQDRVGGKTYWQRIHGKHIHWSGNKWQVAKSINNKMHYFGRFDDFQTAMNIRDQLVENDWDKSKVVYPEDWLLEKQQLEYYRNVHTHSDRRYYKVHSRSDRYYGSVKTIEEALYYRDILDDLFEKGEVKPDLRPTDFDLITNNPYLKNGLDYPLPERLKLKEYNTGYRKGEIRVKGPQSYHLYHRTKDNGTGYVCACRTYEQAYHVRQEMNKVDWDLSKLDEILDAYPVWYTWLMNFWKYINPDSHSRDKWNFVITPSINPSGKLEKIICRNVEDALFERDMFLKYDGDEELMTECGDYRNNPYYDMELPPYPQRKIRRIKDREDRTGLFNDLYDALQDYPDISQEGLCEMVGTGVVSLRGILRKEFDTELPDFIRLCLSGEHPNDVLEQKPLIYTPNLERDYGGKHIAYYPDRASPYAVTKWFDGKNHYYGEYPTEELAKKIIKDLKKCGWDKSQLKKIQAKHGHVPMMGSKRWVYANKRTSKRTGKVKIYSYSIRHKDKDKRIINYGTYKDKRVAELVRDLLILYDWDKAELCWIQDLATYTIEQADNNWRCRL